MGFLDSIFGKKKELKPISLASLKVDMHSHLIPGVDDGARSTEDSIKLIRHLSRLGFSHFITTPHIMSDIYPNSKDDLLKRGDVLRLEIEKEGLDVTLEVAAEYFLDEHFMSLIRKKELLTFGDGFLLFEMSFMEESPLLQESIFELQSMGIKPILAHPERYVYLHSKFEKYEELEAQGVHLQLNLNSLTGHYSPQVLKIAEKLIDHKLISFVGTDCHHMGHVELSEIVLSNPYFQRLVQENILLNHQLSN